MISFYSVSGTPGQKWRIGTDTSGSGAHNFYIYDANHGSFPVFVDGTSASTMVGINTSVPRAALDVGGAFIGKAATSNSTATIDFSTGNTQYTTSNCSGYNLWNMKDGGQYIFVVEGTGGGICSFTAYSDAGTTGLTIRTGGVSMTASSSTMTMFKFTVVGSYVLVTAQSGL
jgi:hypothetical protein